MADRSFTNAERMELLRELELEASDDAVESIDAELVGRTASSSPGKPTMKLRLIPSTPVLEKGGCCEIKVVCTLTGLTERDLLWRATALSVVSMSRADSPDTWTIEGLSEGLVQITAVARADPNAQAKLFVRVLPPRK
jgi:hypothetical protein